MGLAMLETVVRFDLGGGMREEEEECKGARNKYLYLCGGVILPSGASLHPVAAGNHVHRRRRCHTITITDLLTRRDWCTDWSVDGQFSSRSILHLPASAIDSGPRLR
jgi:hypothetical protein